MTARDYAKVLPSFWTGTTGRAIRNGGDPWTQVIAVYLLTSPHSSAIGLYHLPIAYVCADTGSPLEGALKALESLSEVGFAHYDERSETVWIPEMARHQVGESVKPTDNRRSWLVKEAERMRKRPFFNDFLAKYGEAYSLGIPPERKPLGSPLEAPSDPLRSQEQEKEQEREQERERESRAHAHAREASPSPGTDAMLRSLAPTPDRDAQVVALVTETRGTRFRPISHTDRDAVSRLGEWAAGMPGGIDDLRRALVAFWTAKGKGASLRWLADEDPGRYLSDVAKAPSRPGAWNPCPPASAFKGDDSELVAWERGLR